MRNQDYPSEESLPSGDIKFVHDENLEIDMSDPYNEIVEYSPETPEEAEERWRASEAQILGDIMLRAAESAAARSPQPEPAAENPPASPQDWLFIEDIRGIFACGDSKARGIMRELPCVRIGKRNAVRRADLDEHIEKNGGVVAKWPKRMR